MHENNGFKSHPLPTSPHITLLSSCILFPTSYFLVLTTESNQCCLCLPGYRTPPTGNIDNLAMNNTAEEHELPVSICHSLPGALQLRVGSHMSLYSLCWSIDWFDLVWVLYKEVSLEGCLTLSKIIALGPWPLQAWVLAQIHSTRHQLSGYCYNIFCHYWTNGSLFQLTTFIAG